MHGFSCWTPWGVVLDDTMKLRGVTPGSLADQSNEAHACLGMALAAVDGTEVRTLDAAKDAVANPDAGVRLHFQKLDAFESRTAGPTLPDPDDQLDEQRQAAPRQQTHCHANANTSLDASLAARLASIATPLDELSEAQKRSLAILEQGRMRRMASRDRKSALDEHRSIPQVPEGCVRIVTLTRSSFMSWMPWGLEVDGTTMQLTGLAKGSLALQNTQLRGCVGWTLKRVDGCLVASIDDMDALIRERTQIRLHLSPAQAHPDHVTPESEAAPLDARSEAPRRGLDVCAQLPRYKHRIVVTLTRVYGSTQQRLHPT
eukprot:gene12714-biopygen43